MSRLSTIIRVRIDDLDAPSPQPQHLGEVGVLKEQRAGELVVFLVECPAGDEDPDHCLVRGSQPSALGRREIERVEQEREGGVGLAAVLRPQAEQHDAAGIHLDRHDGGAAGHDFLAPQPARRDDVHGRIARDDGGPDRREAFDRRENGLLL